MAERFLALYGPPQTDNPALYFSEWARVFDGTDAEILTAATDFVIRQHRYPNWPTIGECCEAVDRVAEHINARRARERARLPAPPPPVVTQATRKRVAALVDECKRSIARASMDAGMRNKR